MIRSIEEYNQVVAQVQEEKNKKKEKQINTLNNIAANSPQSRLSEDKKNILSAVTQNTQLSRKDAMLNNMKDVYQSTDRTSRYQTGDMHENVTEPFKPMSDNEYKTFLLNAERNRLQKEYVKNPYTIEYDEKSGRNVQRPTQAAYRIWEIDRELKAEQARQNEEMVKAMQNRYDYESKLNQNKNPIKNIGSAFAAGGRSILKGISGTRDSIQELGTNAVYDEPYNFRKHIKNDVNVIQNITDRKPELIPDIEKYFVLTNKYGSMGEKGGSLFANGKAEEMAERKQIEEKLRSELGNETFSYINDMAQYRNPIFYLKDENTVSAQKGGLANINFEQSGLAQRDREYTENKMYAPKAQQKLMNATESIPLTAASAAASVVHPYLGLGLMGATSYGNSYAEAQQKEYNPAKSAGVGAAKALIEVGTEAMPITEFSGAITSLAKTGIKGAAKNIAKTMGSQLIEENIGEQLSLLGEKIVDQTAYGDGGWDTYLDEFIEIAEATTLSTLFFTGATLSTSAALGAIDNRRQKKIAENVKAVEEKTQSGELNESNIKDDLNYKEVVKDTVKAINELNQAGKLGEVGTEIPSVSGAEDGAVQNTNDMARIVEEYKNSTDSDLIDFISMARKNPNGSRMKYELSDVSERLANDIKAKTNIDVVGFSNTMKSNTITHIDKRHGVNGVADQSMADINDIARMQYVIDNYDNIELLDEKSREYKDNKGKYSPLIRLSKRVNGNYYVVEAVPDTKRRELAVISAYKNKAVEQQVADVSSPILNVRNAPPDTAFDNNISQNEGNVKSEEEIGTPSTPSLTVTQSTQLPQSATLTAPSKREPMTGHFAEFENDFRRSIEQERNVRIDEPVFKELERKELTKEQRQVIFDAKNLGIDVTFFRQTNNVLKDLNEEINGAYKDGKIYLNEDTDAPYKSILGHELLHHLKKVDTAAYDKILSMVREMVNERTDFDSIADSIAENNEDRAAVSEEIIADVMGDILQNPARYRQVLRQNMSITQKIVSFVRDMIDRFYKKPRIGYTADKSGLMNILKSSEKELATIMAEGLSENKAAESGEIAKYSKKNSNIYDYTKSFSEQIDDWIEGKIPKRDTLIVGKTPEVLQKIGFNALPVTINQTHIDYVINGTKDIEHNLGESLLKQLPQALENPIAVIKSTGKKGSNTSVVVLLDMKHNNKTVIVPIAIDGYGRNNNVTIDSNSITSIYAKNNLITKLKDAINDELNGKIGVYCINKNKANVLLQTAGHQLPRDPFRNNGFIHSINEVGSKVNTKFKNVTETQQFKRWFGDWQNDPKSASKVVNDDGTPKIVYHQTGSEFTIFDTSKRGAGYYDSETPSGIFLKPSSEDIELSGNRQMALYARIKNPLKFLNRRTAVNWYNDNISGYKELGTELDKIQNKYEKLYEDSELRADEWYNENYDDIAANRISKEEVENVQAEAERIMEEWEEAENDVRKKQKELLNRYFENSNYDGIFIANDDGSYGRKTETYIAFKPNQVKSATDNIGIFDGDNDDIRYSKKGSAQKLYEVVDTVDNSDKFMKIKREKNPKDGAMAKYKFDWERPSRKSLENDEEYNKIIEKIKGKNDVYKIPTAYYTNDVYRIFRDFFGEDYSKIKELVLDKLDDSKRAYIYIRDFYTNILYDKIVNELGIKKGSKMSEYVQLYGEKKMTEKELLAEKGITPNDVEKIKKADKIFRWMYDSLIETINDSRRVIYPNVEKRAEEMRREIKALNDKLGEMKEALRSGDYSTVRNYKKVWQEIRTEKLGGLVKEDIIKLEKKISNKEKKLEEYKKSSRGQRIYKRDDYYRHFREMETGDFAALRNILGSSASISNELAAISEFTKPKSKYLPSAQHRGKEDNTTYDAVGGFLDYVKAASYAAAVDPNIDIFRKMAEDIGKTPISWSEDGKIQGEVNGMQGFLGDYANMLAGKTSPFDRPVQKLTGRKIFSTVNWVTSRIKSNMVLGNIGSSVAQMLNIPNAIGYIGNPASLFLGVKDSVSGILDKKIQKRYNKSTFLNERFSDPLSRFDTKVMNIPKKFATWMLGVLDEVGTKYIWNSAYRQAEKKGIKNPVRYADDLTRRMVAGRGIGEVPLAQQSKLIGTLLPFTLEVGNSWRVQRDMWIEMTSAFRDAPKSRKVLELMKGMGRFLALYAANHLFNDIVELIRGTDGGLFDPIEVILDSLLGKDEDDDDEEEKTLGEGIGQIPGRMLGEVLGSMSMGQYIAALYPENGFPFPWTEKRYFSRDEVFGENNPTRYGTSNIFQSGVGEFATNLVPSYGGSQMSKTVKGIRGLYNEGVYSKNGELKYPVQRTPSNIIKGTLFGRSGFKENSEYYNSKNQGILSVTQTEEYKNAKDKVLQYELILDINRAKKEMSKLQDDIKAKYESSEYYDEEKNYNQQKDFKGTAEFKEYDEKMEDLKKKKDEIQEKINNNLK